MTYLDEGGAEQTISAGAVILATGTKSDPDACAAFHGAAPQGPLCGRLLSGRGHLQRGVYRLWRGVFDLACQGARGGKRSKNLHRARCVLQRAIFLVFS